MNIFQKYKKLWIAGFLIIFIFVLGELVLVNFMGSAPGSFLSLEQILLTIKLSSFIALFGLCQMLVISVGGNGLDLSVGYIATLTVVLTAKIMDGSNEHLLYAILIAIAIGAATGIVNGLLTAYAKLPPLVITMAMANILQGIVNAYSAGFAITGRPSPVLSIIAAKSTGIFPNILAVLIVVAIVVSIIMHKTKIGVKMMGVGTNEVAAHLSGIDVKKIRFIAFIASGIIAGLIGLLLVGNAGQAYKDMGSIYVMPSIVAVIVGGISISGGEGNYIGVILGAIALQTLTNLFIALGLGDAGKWAGYGIILFFMLVAYVRSRRSR